MPSVMFLVSYVFLKSESLTGPAIWGLIFGTLAYWSKGLAIPIGFHTGVNFVQALFSQKEKWASGIWTFDIADEITPFTVDQITVGMKIFCWWRALFSSRCTFAKPAGRALRLSNSAEQTFFAPQIPRSL